MSKQWNYRIAASVAVLGVAFSTLVGCESKGPAEKSEARASTRAFGTSKTLMNPPGPTEKAGRAIDNAAQNLEARIVRRSNSAEGKQKEIEMAKESDAGNPPAVTREDLVALLNEDLAREYQAIISYVVYSQTLKGAEYMNIAAELETHAAEELAHALIIAGQIDYLGGMPLAVPKPVKTSAKAEDMLRFDLDNENETIHHYRQRVRQCEALGEYALAEHIRDILVQEQDHQIALANALGVEIPNVTKRGD